MAGIQWGSVADWVSGIGSLSAAVVALYVALSARRIRLQGYCGERIIVGPGQPKVDVFSISVTNISQRPTVITNIGFTFGIWRRKKHGIITFMPDQYGHGIPKALPDGETGTCRLARTGGRSSTSLSHFQFPGFQFLRGVFRFTRLTAERPRYVQKRISVSHY